MVNILGSFAAFPIFDKLASRKRLVVELNGVKFGLGVSIQCIDDAFDRYVIKVILGSSGAIPIFDKLVSQ